MKLSLGGYIMYSKKEENQVRKFERDGFRKLKEYENNNKNVPMSDDILYISDFDLKKFPNSGDSGDLYLATNKHNYNEKYILKHEYYDCACNEYMYSKIGNKMGIKIAPVKLFILDVKDNKFKSDFVCGIKYLENCEHVSFNYIEENKDIINNWKDYFRMFCLETLFDESDGIEVIKYQNEIYRLDTTAAFTISDFYIYPLAYDYNKDGINIREWANDNILKRAKRNSDSRISKWEFDKKNFIEKFGCKYLNYYLETYQLLKNISDEDIEEWVTNLTFFYPNVIGEYFKIYISNLKLDVEKFLIKIDENNLLKIKVGD